MKTMCWLAAVALVAGCGRPQPTGVGKEAQRSAMIGGTVSTDGGGQVDPLFWARVTELIECAHQAAESDSQYHALFSYQRRALTAFRHARPVLVYTSGDTSPFSFSTEFQGEGELFLRPVLRVEKGWGEPARFESKLWNNEFLKFVTTAQKYFPIDNIPSAIAEANEWLSLSCQHGQLEL